MVKQDTRGKHESEGEFYPFVNERSDGLTTIKWIRMYCSSCTILNHYALPAHSGLVYYLNKIYMQNFTFYNPVKIVFGKGTISELTDLIDKKEKMLTGFTAAYTNH